MRPLRDGGRPASAVLLTRNSRRPTPWTTSHHSSWASVPVGCTPLALALVITYRASGVLNFATGAMALYVAYTYAGLRRGELLVPIPGLPKTIDLGQELGFWPAVLISMVVAAVLGALYVLVFRPLRDAPPLAKAVAPRRPGDHPGRAGDPPGHQRVSVAHLPRERWEWNDVIVLSDRFYLAVTVVGLALLVGAGYRYTRFGLLTRATAESQTGAYVSASRPIASRWSTG